MHKKRETMPVNADTINTLIDAMGALTIAATRQFTPEQRKGFKRDLAALAGVAEKQGNTALETLLMDLHTAAVN